MQHPLNHHLRRALAAAVLAWGATHVPYKSNPPTITALLGGQIDLMITDSATGMPQVQADKLRALGYSSRPPKRSRGVRSSRRPASRPNKRLTGEGSG